MKKFEYAQVRTSMMESMDGVLNAMGSYSWELVSVNQIGTDLNYIFKRELNDKSKGKSPGRESQKTGG